MDRLIIYWAIQLLDKCHYAKHYFSVELKFAQNTDVLFPKIVGAA